MCSSQVCVVCCRYIECVVLRCVVCCGYIECVVLRCVWCVVGTLSV